MKKTLTLICIVLAAATLSGCKSEKELQAEAIKKQELADLKKPSSAATWKAPDLSKKKTDKGEKQ
ncbi:MAG: hypothetical protein ACK5A0_14000 [Polaromonas sp.]|jgi:outer membrane murein-binding lipoprotein Lpp